MLSQLYIKNIAVISETTIDFSAGLNVFTGETGAGKTILINAINAVLGGRTSRDIIRTGEQRALVSALFIDIPQEVADAISEMGYAVHPYEGLLITREIDAESSKGGCKINGRPATLAILREIASLLINLHGQQDNQELLSTDKHMAYIDNFGELAADLAAYRQAYDHYCSIKDELESLRVDEALKAQRMDMLEFQIKEISSAELTPGEEEELLAVRKRIKNAERITDALTLCQQALLGDDGSEGILSLLETLKEGVATAAGFIEELEEAGGKLEEMGYELEELAGSIRSYAEDSGFDPRQLDQIESRLDTIYRLKKKYGSNIDEILAFLEKAQEELESLNNADNRIQQLERQLEPAHQQAVALAQQLTQKRLAAADLFVQQVQHELAFLDMPQVQLLVQRTEKPLSPLGCDNIEFLISPNTGEAPRPLAKIASGGEISRIMLSVKNVLAHKDNIGTLIFDEVDTGVSGRAAQKIGRKLAQVARNRQVLCVTHLAQVAAYADRHLRISKEVLNQRTHTQVQPLNDEQRVRELARIMAGENITETALRSAEEMLRLARGDA